MELFLPALGAVVGFVLAQLANVAQVLWSISASPKLKIDDLGTGCRSLTHGPADDPETIENVYAFGVQNVGHRVAANVRFQIIKIEFETGGEGFDVVEHAALPLKTDDGASLEEVTLVPKARITVRLAAWRDNTKLFAPASSSIPFQYYDMLAQQTGKFRFTVVAFDKDGRFTSAEFVINPRDWRGTDP